ncbi:hypothetical protein AB0B12_32275 [Streptomyces sp. NPDC044780]|uniref:hypothetical protein n=1 Tax=unclassified Streptomyces TaxID=2593676 RepID=UPI0033EE9F24
MRNFALLADRLTADLRQDPSARRLWPLLEDVTAPDGQASVFAPGDDGRGADLEGCAPVRRIIRRRTGGPSPRGPPYSAPM